jgi:hypothetical protein
LEGGPRFDPNNFSRTLEWVATVLNALQKDKDNTIRYRSTWNELYWELQALKGAKVRWVLEVHSIQEDYVVLENVYRKDNGLHLVDPNSQKKRESSRGMALFSDGSLALEVGQEISKEKAAELNPGDKITVTAKVADPSLENLYYSISHIKFVLEDLRVE